jgi:hypothetical protein
MALKSDVISAITKQVSNMLQLYAATNNEIKNKDGKLLYFKA